MPLVYVTYFKVTYEQLLYIGLPVLGMFLRTFYFAWKNKGKLLKEKEVKSCAISYFFVYPLMLLGILSLMYFLFYDRFDSAKTDVFLKTVIYIIIFYFGFDIKRIGDITLKKLGLLNP